MASLTEEDYAWCKRIGISRERADFLASCPKLTKCGDNDRPPETRQVNLNHNLQLLAGHFYFRLRKDGKDIRCCLGDDLVTARTKRDALLADYNATRHLTKT